MMRMKEMKPFTSLVLVVSLTICILSIFSAQNQLSSKFYSSDKLLPVSSNQTCSNSTTRNTGETVNVLYGLSGNHSGFLHEVSISLKSVLLNAPLDSDLDIYIMADTNAYHALPGLFQTCELKTWKTRQQISIYAINVERYLDGWKSRMIDFYRTNYSPQYSIEDSVSRHTLGTFYRLFANDVLPNHVQHVIYMDPDVVVISNLQEIWKLVDPNVAFQWGVTQCAGFMLLHVPELPTVWKMAAQSPFAEMSKARGSMFSDQDIFVVVNQTFPQSVGLLPPAWDVSVANDMWRLRTPEQFLASRPHVGMLHFNGGGSTQYSAFLNHSFLVGPQVQHETWGMANSYTHMPWSWARYSAASRIAPKQDGYPLKIQMS